MKHWIKIESESDLPKTNDLIWVVIEGQADVINVQPDISNDDYYGSDGMIYHGKDIAYYQKIVKPKMPEL